MRLGRTLGTRKLVEKYPSLMDSSASNVTKMSLKLLIEGTLWQSIRTQRVLTKRFERGIERINFDTEKAIVQIGANDGLHSDPLRPILASRDMRAVLVEPMPVAFEALSQLYADRANTQLVNRAISTSGGRMVLYTPKVKGNELQSTLWACRSKEQAAHEVERNMGRKALQEMEITEVPVLSQTASELCSSCQLTPEDVAVLVCDTEGQDAEVVGSFLDAGSLPEMIFYEQIHVPHGVATQVKERLSSLGYELFATHKDVLASRTHE